MRQVLPLPYNVNPLIKLRTNPVEQCCKLCRWSLLVAGVIYGFRRRKELAVTEHEFQIKETEMKAKVAKALAEERAIANADELAQLERIFLSNDKKNHNNADVK